MTTPALGMDVVWTLARASVPDEERAAIAARLSQVAASGAKPADLVRRLADHGVVPLAYRHLIAGGPLDLPPAFSAELSAEFRRHAVSRFRFARRLRELLDGLETAGVEAVPYKGPALAIQLYGNYAMRQYGDLDILVRPSQVERALQTLEEAGLVRHRPSSPEWEPYLRRTRHAHELRDPRAGVAIELHWSVADRFHGVDLDVAWLLDRPEVVDLLGRPTKTIGGARLLLALCMHGTKHLWARAVWLAELAELVRSRTDLDWTEAFDRADRGDLGRALRASLILTRDRFGVGPPPPWTDRIDRDAGARRLASEFARRLDGVDSAAVSLLEDFRLGLLARGSLARRAAFCWRVATDLSERDTRTLTRPPRFPVLHALRRTTRLVRTARTERRLAARERRAAY